MCFRGAHNSKKRWSILLDNFIRQSSVYQIVTILIIVIALFALAVFLWERDVKSTDIPRVEKVESEIVVQTNNIEGNENTGNECNEDNTDNTGAESEEASNDQGSGLASSSVPLDSLQSLQKSEEKISEVSNSVPELKNQREPKSEEEAVEEEEGVWNKTYDVFVQSINPGPAKENKSTLNKWLIFGLFLLISFGLSGLVFTILINMFERRKEKWENGEINYNIKKNFYLIIGGHKMVTQLCADLQPDKNPRADKNTVIVIQTRRKAIMLRKELEAKIGKKLAKSIFIYNGDRTSWDNLKILNPEYAKEIFIIGEENHFDGNSHDAYSLQCLNLIDNIVRDSGIKPPVEKFNLKGKINCHVMFEYQTSTKIFQYTDRDLDDRLDFIPFNYFEKWAAQVLVSQKCPQPISNTDKGKETPNITKPIGYPSILGPDPVVLKDSEKRVHIIIVGMSKMGTMFGAMAAHVCHFPNFFLNDKHPRTLITFIDANGQVEMNYFKGRNPSLCELARWRYVDAEKFMNDKQVACGSIYQKEPEFIDPMNRKGANSVYAQSPIEPNLMDIDWEFIKGDIATPSVQKYLQEAVADDGCVTTIAVCTPVTYEAVSAAMFMPEEVYLSKNVTQILVLQQTSDAVVYSASQEIKTVYQNKGSKEYLHVNPYQKLRPFGMFDQCSYLTHIDLLPMITNYIYCADFYSYIGKPKEMQEFFNKLSKQLCEDLKRTIQDKEPFGIIIDVIQEYDKINNEKGKSIQASRASNLYNTYSLLYKAKVLGIKPSDKPLNRLDPVEEEKVDMLAQVEHNRWDTEQLFVGYRPKKNTDKTKYYIQPQAVNAPQANDNQNKPAKVEQEWGILKNGKWKDIDEKNDFKLQRIHPDIHSYNKTDADKGLDDDTKIYDINIALMTPVLYKIYEMLEDWN